ncbi:MAG: class I SAM-dependent methyltransferase [Bacteroidota bacterium]
MKNLVERGGPAESEWTIVCGWMCELGKAIEEKLYSDAEITQIYNEIGNAFPVDSIQGHTYHKPRKYAGDFELLDKIQTCFVTPDEHFANWDKYFHSCEAPRAVRYRIPYLVEVLEKSLIAGKEKFSFLNIASGPCRDIYEFFRKNPSADTWIDCVDHDPDAVSFARNLLQPHSDKITFYNTNFLRFIFPRKYDLIWSAGLFDYFDDAFFVRKLKLMIGNLNPGGKIIIGNLTDTNPSKYYMLLFKWIVFHRTEEHLTELAREAGAEKKNIFVDKEPLGVNLFLHISNE